jgi:hypothetical protein
MATLALKKKSLGYYEAENDTHLITVSKTSDGVWELTIEEKTHLSTDQFSKEKNLVQMTDVLFNCFTDTKKQAVQVGTDWVIKNL